jgi:HD-GYP domain-containing protein (c-di-GMP phosphodiesterase class II)
VPPAHCDRSLERRITRQGYLNPSNEGTWPPLVKRPYAAADVRAVSSAAHSLSPALDPDASALIEEVRERGSRRLQARARWTAIAFGAGFLAAAAAVATSVPSDRPDSWTTFALLVAAYALTSRVKFEVGTGFAVPTQLVLVPMLFALPLALVPLAVALGILLGRSVDYVRRRAPLDHALSVLPNAWYALGPVIVLAAAGEGPPRLDSWPVYVGALAAQFATDFAFGTSRELIGLGVGPRTLLPYMAWAFLVDAALAPVGLLAAIAAHGHPTALVLILPLAALLSVFARERQIRIDHALELGNAYRGTAFLLGDVIEADDEYTGSHSRDVVSLVLAVADDLGLNGRDRRDAEFSALLHDVGKIRIPSEIINKPGPLTAEERAVIETHTVAGEELLARVGGILGNVGRIVRSCHEDWDGSGYPDGLRGDEIPLVARIVRCCDAFSAMTTDRPYRAARSTEEALAEMRSCSRTDFDPDVVDALARVLAANA